MELEIAFSCYIVRPTVQRSVSISLRLNDTFLSSYYIPGLNFLLSFLVLGILLDKNIQILEGRDRHSYLLLVVALDILLDKMFEHWFTLGILNFISHYSVADSCNYSRVMCWE